MDCPLKESTDGEMSASQGCAQSSASGALQGSSSVATGYVPSLAQNVLSYIILLGGALSIAGAAYLTITSYTGIAFWDEWDTIRTLLATHRLFPVGWLFKQHNEHRMFLYKLLFLADLNLFHGRQVLLFVSMYVIQFGFLATFAWMLRGLGELRGALWRTSVGLAAFCLFCPSQWENFSMAFQVSFFAAGFLALLAVLSVVLYQRSRGSAGRGWPYVVLGVLVASIATYSNGNGIFVWPILLGIAAMLRMPLKTIGVYALCGFCVGASYFFNYATPSQSARPIESFHHMPAVGEYVATYFGSSFPWGTIAYSVPIGWEALFAAAALIAWAIARRRQRHPLFLILAGLLLFSLMTAFITALARVNLGTNQATASRYQTFALLFWFCLSTLLLLALAGAGGRGFVTALMAGVVIVMAIAAANYRMPLRVVKARRAWRTAASLALVT